MTAYREHVVIALITLCLLSLNSHWGLPSANRLALIGGPEVLQANLPAIERAKTRAKQIGTDNLPYADRIHFAVREFLISPFAGDDNFTLNAIRNLNPFKLKFDPHFYVYGGGFIYTGAVFIQLASWITGFPLVPDAQFYLQHPEVLGQIFGALRTMVVLFASIGIVLTYGMARRFYGVNIARIAWGILVTMPLIHQASRTVEPHIFVLPLFLCAFYFSVRLSKSFRPRDVYLSALFTGLSIGAQVISGYVALAFLYALLLNHRTKHINLSQMIRWVVTYGLIACAMALLINPFYLLNFDGFMADLTRGTGNQLFNAMKFWAPDQLTWFLLILFLCALIYHLVRHKDPFTRLALSCLIAAIPIYVFISNYHMPYIATAMPLAAILSARMLSDAICQCTGWIRTAGLAVAILLFAIFPTARSCYYIQNFTSANREAAGAWINANMPAGTTIGVRFPPRIWDCVAFDFYSHPLMDYRVFRQRTQTPLPDAIVAVNDALPDRLRPHYDLAREYLPASIFGYHFEIDGELHALIGKTIHIYTQVPESNQP